jgi:DNA polymerase-1
MGWIEVPEAEWLETEAEGTAAAQYLYNSCRSGNPLGLDTETTGTDIVKDVPILFSVSDGIRRFAGYCETHMRNPWFRDGLLKNREITKNGSKLKFDRHMLANIGVDLEGPTEDNIVLDWLFNENRQGRHGLKETAWDYCHLKMATFEEVYAPRKGRKGVPAETAGEAIRRTMADPEGRIRSIDYAGMDAFGSVYVRNYLKSKLEHIYMFPGLTLWDHFLTYEVPFTDVLWRMERRGFMIHTGHLMAQMGPMMTDMDKWEATIAELAGHPVNPNSTPQLQTLFFEDLKVPIIKWTDGGKSGIKKPSTDEEVLNEIAGTMTDKTAGQIAVAILAFRSLSKTYGTYIEGLLRAVDGNLRIHSTLNQGGTVTGRISSSDPNLQNIPRPDNDKFGLRTAFIAAPGKTLVVADYDQLEMKLMAHFSGDEKMIRAINEGLDLHCYTVHLMFGVPYEEAVAAKKCKDKSLLTDRMKELLLMRQAAKSIGFGLIYGIGAKKLGMQLTEEFNKNLPPGATPRVVDKKEAQYNINMYFNAFPGVKAFIEDTKRSCRRTEYVQTFLGRFRRLPEINARGNSGDDDNAGVAAQAERQAVNTIIQGTAGDVAKVAMNQAEYDPELNELGAEMLLQIHDELIFEVDDVPEVVAATKKRVQAIMQNPWGGDAPFRVPLTCEAKAAHCWSEAK